MANPAADPKAAPLADELKELALSLPTTVFPKNFFCAQCNQLAFDSFKLICCNKSVCSSCQEKLHFPTTCPSCDHSPLEADSCTPNKSLRSTMRSWLQKQKKKEEAKAAAQPATPPVEVTPAAPEVQPVADGAERPVDSVEETPKADDVPVEEAAGSAEITGDAGQRAGSASAQPHEDTASPEIKTERRGSTASQNVTQSIEPGDGHNEPNAPNGGIMGNTPMMNGMQGQMGFGFPNQSGFNNNGLAWNGMPNMMASGSWNGMNPMDYNNNMNGMYGNYGGNMGLGMTDMSAMNMMQYGGGYGNGWNGMGGGYGNFSGPNQMGGYNQSGAYPEMMNQFPKNNFPNQNQNQTRFHANQGGAHPQRNNRNGSHGGFGPGLKSAHSLPDSRSGPPQNRDGQSPDGTADTAPEVKAEGEQAKASAESTDEGKESANGAPASADLQAVQEGATFRGVSRDVGNDTNLAGAGSNEATVDEGLKPIQTVYTGDADIQDYDQSMMSDGMQPYPQGIMNQFPDQAHHMNASFDPNMNMSMGYHGNNYGPRGGFNNGAYGDATVLTGQPTEPIGVGVVGAPTGPRAMREGRPNTGFSSRVNSGRYPPPPKSVTSTQDAAPGSPQRRLRSRSPLRDENLRVKQRSPTRSRSGSKSRAGGEVKDEQRGRSRSADRESRREDRGRSPNPQAEAGDDYERHKERKQHRSSRYDDREQDYDDRYRDDKASRGDRTRSASAESRYCNSRRDKEKHRSSRSHRDRSKRRHRSRSPRVDDKYEDDEAYTNGEKESDGTSRRKHRSGDKDKHREREGDRSRDKERDRKDRKERDRDYDYDREKDRSRDKDKDRKRRRDREVEQDERDYDDDKHRSSRRSRKDKDRERERDRDYDDGERKEKPPLSEKEEDIVGQMMKKRAISPPLNAPTGPSANGFSIKGRSKNAVMQPPTQPPTGPRAFQPPKGPAADRNKDRGGDAKDHGRKGSASSMPGKPTAPSTSKPCTAQDHYAAERERNARERDSRERVDKPSSKSLHSRISSSSRPSLSSKRNRDDVDEPKCTEAPKGPKADIKAPTGPASHRDKRRKSGTKGDDNIANLFTAGLRKNAKARRGGVRTEGDVEREMERVERERERR
ncbi:hypothetical protein EJ02DRAFT_385705 [Clathrospora elynae]|uniref:RING-type domain-containing protein n=1 Tax=Clathrospora elynae TaxID=706981 RepID=A0A6A5SA06_9PLEO|nr:hypothetical protein EJ02DRAFT_385705 [Clathrospora elynae]